MDELEPGWQPGDEILVGPTGWASGALPDVNVIEDGVMQVVPDDEVAIGESR